MIPRGVNSGNILAEIFMHDGNRHRLGMIEIPRAANTSMSLVSASLKAAAALNSESTTRRLSRPRPK